MQKELKIIKFSENGLGIAFDENRNKILIPNAIINDIVLAEIYRKSKGYRKAEIFKILQPSCYRKKAVCKHFELCGGCIWQNMDYDQQLKEKEKIVIKYFEDFLKETNIKIFPIQPSENIFEYRNKMEFSFSENRKKTKFLGLVMRNKRFIVDIERCYLASLWVSLVLKTIRAWWEKYNFSAFNYFNGEGFLRTLTFKEGKNTQEKMIILTTSNEQSLSLLQKKDFVLHIITALKSDEKLSIYLNTQISEKNKKTVFEQELLFGSDVIKENLSIKDFFKKKINLSFQISPFSFFQPNTLQAEKLYSFAMEHLKDENIHDKIIFDLYSGIGTIGIIFSKFVKKVISVEINEDACIQAKKNAELNSSDNFEIVKDDVANFLNEFLQGREEKPHIVIIDPPRMGLSNEAIEGILKIEPKIILYISCNPKTQFQNVKIFSENNYKLKILHPIDQFPHTYHIENIAILKRT